MNRAVLLAVGCVVLVLELFEDAQVGAQARAAGWDADSVRMLVGHGLREFLVIAALVAIYTDTPWMVPFVLGAAVHGLFFRSGYFIGASGVSWTSAYAWVSVADVLWRLGLLVWGGMRVPALLREMWRKEA